MLQSTRKGGNVGKPQTEARPPTQAFVTQLPVPKVQIAVGDAAQKSAKRAQEATLVGLAPPPIEYAPVAIHVQPPKREPEPVVDDRDDRSLAAILVVGTLIAMFAITLSAVPETAPTKAKDAAPAAHVEPLPMQQAAKASPEAAATPRQRVAVSAPVQPRMERKVSEKKAPRPLLSKPIRTAPARVKPTSKIEPKPRPKLSRDPSANPGARVAE